MMSICQEYVVIAQLIQRMGIGSYGYVHFVKDLCIIVRTADGQKTHRAVVSHPHTLRLRFV